MKQRPLRYPGGLVVVETELLEAMMGKIRFTGTKQHGYTAAEIGVAGQPECRVKHVGGGWAATYTVPPPSGSGTCGTTQVHGIYRSRTVAAGYGIAAHKAAWPGRFNAEGA